MCKIDRNGERNYVKMALNERTLAWQFSRSPSNYVTEGIHFI